MAQVLMVLFDVASDGSQTVVSVQSFNSRTDAEAAFNQEIAKLQATPQCNAHQLDLVDQEGITINVVPYTSVEYGNQLWTQWLALTPGAVSPVGLGGDYQNQETAASDCSLVPFNPTPSTDGSPAVPLTTTTTASMAPPTVEAPIPTPVPVATYTALVAAPAPTTPELAMTGGYSVGPLAGLGLALAAIGAIVVRKTHRFTVSP